MANNELIHCFAGKFYHIRHSRWHTCLPPQYSRNSHAKLGVGPTVENGFYYDFLLPRPITPDDLKGLEKTMRTLVNKKLPFTGREASADEHSQS